VIPTLAKTVYFLLNLIKEALATILTQKIYVLEIDK
jgi:hypothetical protein